MATPLTVGEADHEIGPRHLKFLEIDFLKPTRRNPREKPREEAQPREDIRAC